MRKDMWLLIQLEIYKQPEETVEGSMFWQKLNFMTCCRLKLTKIIWVFLN